MVGFRAFLSMGYKKIYIYKKKKKKEKQEKSAMHFPLCFSHVRCGFWSLFNLMAWMDGEGGGGVLLLSS